MKESCPVEELLITRQFKSISAAFLIRVDDDGRISGRIRIITNIAWEHNDRRDIGVCDEFGLSHARIYPGLFHMLVTSPGAFGCLKSRSKLVASGDCQVIIAKMGDC